MTKTTEKKTETGEIVSVGQVAVYDEFRQQLIELRDLNIKTVFDYEDVAGNTAARSHVHKLRLTKGAVDRARKAEKQSSLEYGRKVDAQAKEIITEIEGMIEVHAKPLREIEEHEAHRLEAHRLAINTIEQKGRTGVNGWIDLPLEQLKENLLDVEAIKPGGFDEFADVAAAAQENAIVLLREGIEKRAVHDAEQAELVRHRKEAEERAQAEEQERARKAEEQRAAREVDAKAKYEQEAAARREAELKLAAETAQREKIEAEQRAAKAEQDAADRVTREAKEKADQEAAAMAKREANKKHRGTINRKAADAFVKGGLAEEAAKQAVRLIADGSIPNVAIAY